MNSHPYPFTIGQLLAVYAVLKARGDDRLAAIVLAHSRAHEDETEGRSGPDVVVEAR